MRSVDPENDSSESPWQHPCADFAKLLSCGFYYFSNDFDLTRNWQNRFFDGNRSEGGGGKGFWELRDDRFFYNKYMLHRILKIRKQLPELERSALDRSGLLVMIIQGFVQIGHLDVSSGVCSLGIVSRLNCRRTGTRFNARGIDDDGNVANFVETEMIILVGKHEFSYVQIRGSIPLFWEQQGIQVGNNKIQISRSKEATKPSFDKHFDEICERYGEICIIDLLSQKEGHEQTLSRAFRDLLEIVDFPDRIQRVQFDFHAVCKTSGFEGISLLDNSIRGTIDNFGCFLFDKQMNQVASRQNGVFRVNCLDCLDRTNVVESYIGSQVGEKFIKSYMPGYHQHLLDYFKAMWANNGDALSMMYAGTGALKSGFTRTGKRTFAGFMDDIRKTATRFYINNFQDKSKQLVIDQILGVLPGQIEVNLYNPIREEVHAKLRERLSEYSSHKPVKILVTTWNVNAQSPDTPDNLSLLLKLRDDGVVPDVIAVGFQEIVELTPSQIMSSDPAPKRRWEEAVMSSLRRCYGAHEFTILTSGQLVGASLSLIVRSEMLTSIRNVSMAIKKTGMGGMAGNKGGVGIRCDIYDSNVCFVCCHFAAGQSNLFDRNRDYETISSGLTFAKNRKIGQHENIIWMGDFNYRIDLPNEIVRKLAISGDFHSLFSNDQLLNSIKSKHAFRGYLEGPIAFPPTYKYDNGTHVYDTSEKMRIPAWTDRVLFAGKHLKQQLYERQELTLSDHRPVRSLFTLEALVIDKQAKATLQRGLYDSCLKALEAQRAALTPPVSALRPQTTMVASSLIDLSDLSGQRPVSPLSSRSSPDILTLALRSEIEDDLWKLCLSEGTNSAADVRPVLPPRPGTARPHPSEWEKFDPLAS